MFPYDYMFNCCCIDCINNGIMTELSCPVFVLYYHCLECLSLLEVILSNQLLLLKLCVMKMCSHNCKKHKFEVLRQLNNIL